MLTEELKELKIKGGGSIKFGVIGALILGGVSFFTLGVISGIIGIGFGFAIGNKVGEKIS